MSLAKSLLIGAGLFLLASPILAKEKYERLPFRMSYSHQLSGQIVEGTYSCGEDDEFWFYCERISGDGEKILAFRSSVVDVYYGNSREDLKKFGPSVIGKGFSRKSMRASFINETSP